MADITQPNWAESDASNNQPAPDGAPEGMAPGGLNDAIRAVMGAVKRWFSWSNPKTTAGTGTAYTLSYSVPPTALVDAMTHLIQFHVGNSGPATLNVNSLGAKPIHYYTGGVWGAIPANLITANMVARVAYSQADGSYRLISLSRTWLDVLTVRGDLLTRDGAGYVRLGIGAAGTYLRSNGTDAVWAASDFSTGDAKPTFKTTADAGWVMMNDGSIGNASSGATTRANADTEALFTLLWNGIANTWAPVSGGRGANAAADFAANKAMTLPKQLGRALIGAGSGFGLSTRALGETGGSESASTNGPSYLDSGFSGGGVANVPGIGHVHSVPTMPPFSAWNIMIKL